MSPRVCNLCVLALLLAICGCVPPPPDPAKDQELEDLAYKWVERYSEWRGAWRVPAGPDTTLNLGPAAAGSVLRLGVLEGEPHGETVEIRVYVGARQVARWRTGKVPRWAPYQVELETAEGETTLCRLILDSPKPLWLSPCEVVGRTAAPPHVLIFLIDTLREDHVGCYGYARNTTPNIDAFARDAVLVTDLAPQSSWTRPSVGSLFTSTYPNVHGAEDRPDVMRANMPSLAKTLESHGYETHGFVNNPNILPLWGFGKDFYRYADVDSVNWEAADDAKVIDLGITTLQHAAGRPSYLYVHTMGPHGPYAPPADYDRFSSPCDTDTAEEAEHRKEVDLYDGEILYTDAQFGRLIRALKEIGAYENALIVVMADHGEEFWEHGDTGHSKTLYEEVLRIPLLIKLPGNAHAGERRDALVEVVDIAPTLLDILGLPPEPRFQGRSFLGLLETGKQAERIGYASLVYDAKSLRTSKTTQHKYLHNVASHEEFWFDLVADHGEREPLEAPRPGGEMLAAHARRTGMKGQDGLHILMTCGDTEHVVTGTVSGPGLGDFKLDYYEWKGEAARVDNAVRFRLLTHHPSDHAHDRDRWHGEIAEQDNAHLRIAAPPDKEIVLDITVDGAPAPAEIVLLGRDGAHPQPMAGGYIFPKPLELAADSDAYDPAGLPRRFAIYVWYVIGAARLEDADLDPAMRNALEALGYLH